MGCDNILLKVPLFCSELILSNPKLIPRRGPRKLIKTIKGGSVPSEIVNSFKKKKVSSGSLAFTASEKLLNAVYKDPRQVSVIIASMIINLQLFTVSEISFDTMTQKGLTAEFFVFILISSFKIAVVNSVEPVFFSVQKT